MRQVAGERRDLGHHHPDHVVRRQVAPPEFLLRPDRSRVPVRPQSHSNLGVTQVQLKAPALTVQQAEPGFECALRAQQRQDQEAATGVRFEPGQPLELPGRTLDSRVTPGGRPGAPQGVMSITCICPAITSTGAEMPWKSNLASGSVG